MAGFLTATWKGIYFPRAFSTWPSFFFTFQVGIVRQFAHLFLNHPLHFVNLAGNLILSTCLHLVVPPNTPCYEKRGRISVHIKTHLKIAWFSSGRTLLLTGRTAARENWSRKETD